MQSDYLIFSLIFLLLVISFLSIKFYQRTKILTGKISEHSNNLSDSLDAMIDSVIIINRQGIIEVVNSAALKVFGYSKEEFIGKSVTIIMPEPYASEHGRFMKNYHDTEKAKILGSPRALQAKKKDGSIFPITLQVTQNKNANNRRYIGVIHDLTDYATIKHFQIESENILNTAIKSSPSGWVIMDLTGHCILTNRAFNTWLGYDENELTGTNLQSLFNPIFKKKGAKEEEAWEKLDDIISGEIDTIQSEAEFSSKSGKPIWGLFVASLVRSSDNKPLVIVAQILDINKTKLLEIELEQNIQALKKSNEELDQFAFVASHDLKSPLNAIEKLAGWIEEDAADNLPEASKPHLALLKSRSKRMSRLLDDLLTYSRIGRRNYEIEDVVLDDLVNDLKDLNNIPSSFTVSSGAAKLTIQRIPLELVLRNLMSNAVKHHHKESGCIEVTAVDSGSSYEINVIDDGPGIPPSLHARAMDMFQTLKPRDEIEGSGMGMAFCKKTIEYYGGNISIISDGENGTTIHIEWPKPTVH